MNIAPFSKPIYITRPLLPKPTYLLTKIREIWRDQWLTNIGKQHKSLETELRKFLKVKYLSLFNNATIALLTACRALDLRGEVITTPFTFPATPNVLMWNGLTPVFCDIDPVTMNIDADKIEALITKKTSAILAVHVYGTPSDVEKIQNLANKYKLKVIYDAAHAFGVEINGRGIGTYGDISAFSFHATKLFHTAEGGALSFNDPKLKEIVYLLKNFGIKNEEEVVAPGINGKMNEIQAALGLITIRLVEKEREKREKIAALYKEKLSSIEGIRIPPDVKGIKKSHQYFVIRIDRNTFGRSRDEVCTKLRSYNIYTRKYFYPLCSNYPYFRNLPSTSPNNLPIANTIVNEVLALPFYGTLKLQDVKKIASIIVSLKK